MIKFNVPYKDRVTYPCKLSKLFIDICSQVGLETGNTDFTNNDYMILGNPFTNNEDCRTVLSNIAQLAGGFAKIGRDNKVYIKTLKNISNLLKVKDVNSMTVKELNLTQIYLLSGEKDNADEQLDGNNYFNDFSKNEQWGEVNSLIIKLSDIEGENTTREDEESINENGLTELTIADNYFLIDQVEREKVIEPLWNILKGIKYLPFKTTYYGYPYLDVGDIIYVEDIKDNGYISYIFNHKFTFNGSFSGSIETPALTKTQTAYKNINNVKTKFRNVEYIVDKIKGQISSIVEEQTTITQNLDETNKKTDNNYQDINKKLEGYATNNDLVSVKNSVETLQTSTDYYIGITKDIQVNGVSKVATKTGFTFDDKGLTIEKTDAKTKSTLNETGLNIKDATGSSEESLLFAGYDNEIGETVVKSKNMTVEKYLTIGKHSRIEDYEEGTGVFWIGG